ncbi:hypothetical protein [Umezakia ovalisporum]|uniref:Uncharacterized protein n=1 Tax=Umezakia ovalisporum FSS-43 TaxID=2740520 RepID=A0ABT6JZ31_9CYAN|nr:hypothetical protein [Umezakia ovalisporum]MDH6055384.1 hypothetical protein [Umezakia ovalisporum FSS-43]MDH6068031.1 hypothetical protein [Umezakia ovalisporum APH033B]MDH6083823.1 hypothetical protein [Umezakia ovalisporum TAC611]MDH6087160.1 hypothetical protein [Umezakia ovalisporum Ak1311]MDH6103307.1 hypothetical protein [Umezakia ovalisporum ANA283AFssAo]
MSSSLGKSNNGIRANVIYPTAISVPEPPIPKPAPEPVPAPIPQTLSGKVPQTIPEPV